MIGGNTFLSLLPKGLFNFAVDGGVCGDMKDPAEDKVRKRRRDDIRTPRLVSPSRGFSCGCSCACERESDNNDCRPRKRLRGRKIDKFSPPPSPVIYKSTPKQDEGVKKKQNSDLIQKLPTDVVANCLSFLGSKEDLHALQNTCKLFRDISNSESMLVNVDLVGDLETGKGGIIQELDTPSTASAALAPFARAGNLQALYM